MKWGADKSLSQAGTNKRRVREKQQSKQQSKETRKSKQKKQSEKASKHPVDLYSRRLSEDFCVLRLDQQDTYFFIYSSPSYLTRTQA
jgi:hypothetical protein